MNQVREHDASGVRLRFNQFDLDEADARLTRAGQPVPLAPKAFAVLCALARTPRALVTKEALLDRVWGHRFVGESVLKSAVAQLRARLGDDPKRPRYIETVQRRGYRFIGADDERCAGGGASQGSASTLETLCRADASLAGLVRALAAALDRDAIHSTTGGRT